MAGPAVYLGRQGSTGDSTGEHFHFTLKNKKGQTIPFSTARTDVGQYLQYRLPGSEEWVNLYKKNPAGGFTSAPYMHACTMEKITLFPKERSCVFLVKGL
jgi:murein DD-endopeptidase MepM/ murein hydrolase activator NlpD